ncbi:MAG: transmembrane anchor protein [Alphaproteobacteria bacterium]
MYNSNIPSDTEVPSTAKLIKSTVVAAITAGILLVTVVMPAEYGIDPTGVGKVLGLTRMGEIKTSLAEEAAKDVEMDKQKIAEVEKTVEDVTPKVSAANKSDQFEITLAAGQSTEIKLAMNKDAKVSYSWDANGAEVFFDVHGDSKKLQINYHKYYKGTADKKDGVLEAAFDGSHGWYFKNRNQEPVNVVLKVDGEYSSFKRY